MTTGPVRWPCVVVPPLVEAALTGPPASRHGDVELRPDGEPHRDGEIRVDHQSGQVTPAGRPPDDPVSHAGGSGSACRTELHGWAGAHRHGAVRPRPRSNRRERPPRRWC